MIIFKKIYGVTLPPLPDTFIIVYAQPSTASAS
jgi:hypothetical protein